MEFIAGLELMFQPENFLFVVLGTLAGIAFGAVPGLDATTGTALLLPVTYVLSPIQALLFFSSLYAGGMFGGAITAVLFRVPGSSEAVMTAIEGYEFTRRGEGGFALGVALTSSAIGGLLSTIVLMTVSPFLASVALRFGPGEYFALGVLGLSAVSGVTGQSLLKGVLSTLFGLLLATVGMDATTGAPRFTFGSSTLLGGIPFVPAIIGLFAASEVLRRTMGHRKDSQDDVELRGSSKVRVSLPSLREMLAVRWTLIRAFLIGLTVGILPGAGATTASIVSYSQEQRFSRNRHKFGKGCIEGLVAPETANNAAAGGAMVPLLGLGIPGSGTTAVMIGAFLIHGLQPGPLLFQRSADVVYAMFAGMLFTNVVVLVLGALFVRLFARLLAIPYPIMATSIMSFCVLGSMAFGDVSGVLVMLCFGVLGYFMERYGFPISPVILGMVLGPIIERSLRRALLMNGNDFWAVVSQPIPALLLSFSLLTLLAPLISARRRPVSEHVPTGAS